MDMQKLTEKSKAAMIQAQTSALEYGHQEIQGVHLLKSLILQENGLIPSILNRLQINMDNLLNAIEEQLRKIPSVSGSGAQNPYASRTFNQILVEAKNEAEKMNDEYISVEHLFLALLSVDKTCAALLEKYGATEEKILLAL